MNVPLANGRTAGLAALTEQESTNAAHRLLLNPTVIKHPDARERSGTVALYAALADGNEELLRRTRAKTSPPVVAALPPSGPNARKSVGRAPARDDAHQRPKREGRRTEGGGRERPGAVAEEEEEEHSKRRDGDVSSRPMESGGAGDRKGRPRRGTHDHEVLTGSGGTKTREERKRDGVEGGSPWSGKAGERPRGLTSSGNTATSQRGHQRRRSWSKDERRKQHHAGHRRSKSRTETQTEDRLSEVIASDLRRERKGSDPLRGRPQHDPRNPRARTGAQEGTETTRSPLVAPLNLKPRGRSNSESEGPNDGDATKARKTLRDRMALLLSPGRRPREEDVAPPAADARTLKDSRGSGGDEASGESSLSSSSSSKTKAPRDKRRYSDVTREGAQERTTTARSSPQDTEGSGDKEEPLGKDKEAQPLETEGAADGNKTEDANAPRRRSVLALRKRFSTGTVPSRATAFNAHTPDHNHRQCHTRIRRMRPDPSG